RWTACDPAGRKESPNLYAAFRNSPARFIDPSGRADNEVFTEPAGSGYRRQTIGLNVDEVKSVGEPGISQAESMRRAKDMGERQILDSMTNSATKGNRVEVPIVERAPLPPTSVKDNPSAVFRPRLGGVKEWDEVTAKILKDNAGRIKGKTPGQVKEILNEA